MARVRETLEGFEAVSHVEFDPAKEQFSVEYKADFPRGEEFRSAVAGVVIFPGVRRFLGRVGDQLHNSRDTES